MFDRFESFEVAVPILPHNALNKYVLVSASVVVLEGLQDCIAVQVTQCSGHLGAIIQLHLERMAALISLRYADPEDCFLSPFLNLGIKHELLTCFWSQSRFAFSVLERNRFTGSQTSTKAVEVVQITRRQGRGASCLDSSHSIYDIRPRLLEIREVRGWEVGGEDQADLQYGASFPDCLKMEI